MTKPRSAYFIRSANGKDPSVAELLCDMHEEVFGDSAPQVDPPNEGYWWLAWHPEEDEPVGFAGLKKSVGRPNTGYLYRVGVLPEHRGHRLQARLISVRERKARALGLEWMISDTTDAIPSSNSLIRAGYRLFEPEGPWAFENTNYWEKRL